MPYSILRRAAVALPFLLAAAPTVSAQLTVVQTASETLTVGAWLQPAFDFRSRDPGADGPGFYLRRFRLDLQGSLFDGSVRFRINPDFAYDPQPFDLWVELRSRSGIALRMGQQTVPFNLEREKHMGRAHFGERSLPALDFELSRGRDIGAVVTWRSAAGDRQVSVGGFNGLGHNTRTVNSEPLLSARGIVAFGGPIQTGQSDITRTASPVINLGLGVMHATNSALRSGPDDDWTTWTADALFRWRGYSAVAAAFGQTDSPPGPAPELNGRGWFLSGGWLIPERDAQLSARFSSSDEDRNDAIDPGTELAGGLTIFHRGHEVQSRVQVILLDLPNGPTRISITQITFETQILLGG